MLRRTKIVATVGPASASEKVLRALMEAGANVFRLNFSHGTHDDKREWIARIRKLSKERRQAVAILGDLQGPKIRTGLIEGGTLLLEEGEKLILSGKEGLGRRGYVSTNYPRMAQDVKAGDHILLDDGLIELVALGIVDGEVEAQVRVGGILKDRKGINLPGAAISVPAITAKDEEDLAFCLAEGLDWVALSFVRSARDIWRLKDLLYAEKGTMQVVAKIEKPEAVEDFDAILEAADGIMVARGDLGVEISPERVPLIQKEIIRKCNRAGKPVITATQMLESMITNPRPTRAETSDVANAILDGTDAIMLSAETASGKYPVEAVSLMARVAHRVEADPGLRELVFHPLDERLGYRSLPEAIGQAACRVAENLDAAAILAFTQTGSTVALVSKYRPTQPIYAVTPSQTVRRRLALFAGVRSLRVDIEGDTESQINSVERAVLEAGLVRRGDVVVITMGSPISAPGTTNLLKVHRLGTGSFYEVH